MSQFLQQSNTTLANEETGHKYVQNMIMELTNTKIYTILYSSIALPDAEQSHRED
jgi:hypothetical protein